MSKFFQSKTYTEIDDSDYSYNTTWSSNRIVKEIKKPKMKLEELENVIINNNIIDDNYILSYSKSQDKWTATPPLENTTGNGNVIYNGYSKMNQVNKRGVTGTVNNPAIICIPYETVNFKIPEVNILKYKLLEKDLIMKKNEFLPKETEDFEIGDYIIFDGQAKLKTEYNISMIYDQDLNAGLEWSAHINKIPFKEFKEFELISDTSPILRYKAIPKDQILIQKNDYSLLGVEDIQYFHLDGKGKNIRIVCSVDSGQTWRYFNGEIFERIDNLTIESINLHGNTIEEFNYIKDKWNYILKSKKIRFAYLLSMDNYNDIEYIESLSLKYNGKGIWVRVKDSDYDIEFSGSEMKVYCYISGDIKINYETDSEILNTYEKHWTKESVQDLSLLFDIKDIFVQNKYHAISNNEFVIKNNINSIDKETDIKPENQLHLVITDNDIAVLDVLIPPQNTQKYILGISPNLKIFIKGQFDANLYMTVC